MQWKTQNLQEFNLRMMKRFKRMKVEYEFITRGSHAISKLVSYMQSLAETNELSIHLVDAVSYSLLMKSIGLNVARCTKVCKCLKKLFTTTHKFFNATKTMLKPYLDELLLTKLSGSTKRRLQTSIERRRWILTTLSIM